MEFKDIPHVKQPTGSNMCGAACIEMIYKYHGINRNQYEIWDNVKTRQFNGAINCSPIKMVEDLITNKFYASVCSSNDVSKLLDTCFNENLFVIIYYRMKSSYTNAHFSLMTKIEGGSIYVNNPWVEEQEGKNQRIRKQNLLELMRKKGVPGEDITINNSVVIISKDENEILKVRCEKCGNTFFMFKKLQPILESIGCHSCGYVTKPEFIINNVYSDMD